MKDAYFGAIETDERSRVFLQSASRIAKSAPGQAAAADLAVLTSAARGPLLNGLEQVVSIHQAQSEGRMERLEAIQWAILATVLVTLSIEGLFIFRPMVLRTADYIGQLMQLADNDYLTGIPNRRAFTTRAASEVERARRHRRNLSLLILDADHFKRVNDVHGHLAGDAVLVALGKILRNVARREDVIGRIGGEEFAVLLPETSLRQAMVVAETPIDAHGTSIPVTVSIGLASVPLDAAEPLNAAMKTADSMLYRAKDAGRNCCWPRLSLTEVEVA